MEALDIAFVSKFINRNDAQEVTENLCDAFKDSIITDYKLKIDVATLFSAMIIKHFPDKNKQKQIIEDD